MEQIKVISHLEGTLRGRFDGKDYVFKKGEAVTIPKDAATHIFALGEEDKTNALNHLGFLIPGRDTLEDALAKLDKITFLVGRTVFDDDAEEEPPAKGRTGGRPHVSGPGGEQAAGGRAPAAANPAS